MSQRHPLALVAGASTLLAALPLSTVFATFTWLFYTAIGIAIITGTAMAVRSLRGPLWAQVLAMGASLLLYVTWSFPSGDEFAKFIPTASTFRHFGQLLTDASGHVREEAVPVGDFDGLLLLTIAGVGLVAILVDFLAVGIRRPALAGLPMLAIYSVPVAVLPRGLSFLPFGFAAAGYLWLLVTDSVDRVRRFGRRFTGEGRDVDVWEPSPLASAGRRLGVVGIIIAIMLPLAVPGMTSGVFDRFGRGFGGIGEGGDATGPNGPTVNMFALLDGALKRDEAFTMIKLTTDDPNPYYLRFGTADQIANNGFANRASTSGQRLADALTDVPPPRAGVLYARHSAQVEVVAFDMRLAPIYLMPTASEGLNNTWFFDSSSNQVFSRQSSVNGRTYNFEYVRMNYTPAALRTAGLINQSDLGLRQLASVPQVQQITDLVVRLTASENTQYDKVRAIHDHFSSANGFAYSLTTEPGDSGHPIVDFLANKRGFCVQYAAAMAWLVRAAGFPARVAFGFTRGSPPVNGVRFLTNFNLHAWTEVYFQDFGWVPFDPTPSGSVIGSSPTAWAPDPSEPDLSGPGVQEPEITPGPPVTAPPGGPGETGTNGSAGGGLPAVAVWSLAGAAALLVLVMLMLTPALRRRSLRRSRLARSGSMIVLDGTGPPRRADPGTTVLVLDDAAIEAARRDAHAAWAELLDTLIDFEVPVDEAETPRATGVRLGYLPGFVSIRNQAELLARAEERARYARAPLHPDGLDQALRATRDALAEQATRWQRISATLLPRSVLLRWRLAWVGWVNRSISVAARVREAVAQASPRRLLTERATR
jgi:transglutaminase-like putative cysteine protease